MEAIRKHPTRVEYLLKLNSVSKHLERLADMATNVAEDVLSAAKSMFHSVLPNSSTK